jgi:ABC-type sugar transport system ATPase subunit
VISVEGLSLRQGDFELRDVSFTVPAGIYGVLMGKSGCGKTTILEVICGLRPMWRGLVRLDCRDVTGLRPGERGVGYVPQDRALFPTMIVREQLAFALVLRREPQKAIAGRVEELADLLGIERLLDRLPGTLSGGEAQRVALGRALACRPSVLCLDEPLNNLDEETHDEICSLLDDVHRRTGVTVLHVTHSRREARQLGDLLMRLEDGAVREVDIERSGLGSESGEPRA